MEIIKLPDPEAADRALDDHEPMLAAISFDGETAIICQIDEAMEHHILLEKAGFSHRDIDRFFRIVLDEEGADWTFICPPDYKGIKDRQRRIAAFYRDGFEVIPQFLAQLGIMVGINIPRRYRRHLTALGE